MAIVGSPEQSGGIFDSIKGALGLFSDVNKAGGVSENKNPTPEDEYESSLSETEIVELISQWKRTYAVYYDPIEKSQKQAFEYWIGRHKQEDNTLTVSSHDAVNNSDNRIFNAIETFLPIATRANPDPLVSADNTEFGQQVAHDLKVALVNEADVQVLRRKLAKMTRHWVLYRLGVVKVSWDTETKSIRTEVLNPKRIILDKDGHIDEKGRFVGEYVGEKKKASAKKLIGMFPKKREIIEAKAHKKLATKLEYFEWWYQNSDVFYTIDDTVLGKFKNPHWNYDGEEVNVDPETQAEEVTEIQGTNHLKQMWNPYIFLAIFNTGLQPHDETSLVLQNIPIQDRINRRSRQIDKNVESMNNGLVVSGKAFTEDQATQAASALRRGVAIRVPNGDVREAVSRFPAPELPGDVFNDLKDSRNELDNIFGTAGSSAEGVKSQETVRGKIMINQMDSSRIGGGITEYIEQVADTIYNYWVQMMFVYYDEEHFVTVAGSQGGVELITLKNVNFQGLKNLIVTVKEGSLIPKDPMTQRNEAVDLWSANAIDPLNLYKKLDFPDAVQATNQLILWQLLQKGAIPPQMYLPSFTAAGQQPMQGQPPLPGQQPGTGGPAVNPVGPATPPQTPPVPTSPEAVQQESKQLLASVPAK